MSEHDEQVAVCQYLDLLGVVYCAVPNGGHRHIGVAKKLKAEGVKAGVPDLLLFSPVLDYRGVAIEMKDVKNGSVSPAQREFHKRMRLCGWLVEVCRGSDEAIELINQLYNGGKNERK